MRLKLAVMASGRGSNFQALMEAIQRRELDAEIRILVCDQPEAPAIKIAEANGIPVVPFGSQTPEHIRAAECDLIILAGFMQVLSPDFIAQFPNRILNIHPSLLPRFRGRHAQRQALEHHEAMAGCTVHVVTDEVDGGTVIAQRVIFTEPGDTEKILAGRILKEEHKLLAEAVKHYAGWLT